MSQNYINEDVFKNIDVCPVCSQSANLVETYAIDYSNDKILKLLSINSFPVVNLVHCCNCGHFFASHIINPAKFEHYYSHLNSVLYSNWNLNPFDINRRKHKKYAQEFDRLSPNGKKILDIGCGCGFLLEKMSKKKWDLYGIEPSPYASAVAKGKNIDILAKDIGDIVNIKFKFDIIVMFDVIEHLWNPSDVLSKAIQLLESDGVLIIGTGNISSFNARINGHNWNYLCSYEHISFYTPKSIQYLLQSLNLNSIKYNYLSYQPGFVMNSYELFKNIVKHFVLKEKKTYTGNLAFDHMVIFARR